MNTRILASSVVAAAVVLIGGCERQRTVEDEKLSEALDQQSAGASKLSINAAQPFMCLLFLNKYRDQIDQSVLKPASAFSNYYRAKLSTALTSEPQDVWLPH